MNKLGIQFQWDAPQVLRYNREVQPVAVMGIEVDKLEFYQQLKTDNPDVGLIWRHWPNHPWADDPEAQARAAVDHIGGRIEHLLEHGLIRWVTDNNEFIYDQNHSPPDLIERADRYSAAFIRTARESLGVGTCWGNYNTGHYDETFVSLFPRSLEAAAEDGDSPPCFHEYDWDTLDRIYREDPLWHWLCGRFTHIMGPVLERYPDMKCAITEFGIDRGVIPGQQHEGFRRTRTELAEAIALLCGPHGLEWYVPILQAPYIRFVLWFGCGMGPDWAGRGFDIMNDENDTAMMDRCKTFYFPTTPVPPEPPAPPVPPEPGEDDMTIAVFDMEGNAQTVEWVKKKYGVDFRPAQVTEGELAYRLVELSEKTGHHSLITQVLDEDGRPIQGKGVAFYWPDAPDPPEPQTEVYPHDWYPNFIHGPTNVNGDVGPGMGRGAWHELGEGGPHAVWVRDPNIPSDICEKLGMLHGTNHDHLDQKFQLVRAGSTPAPPQPPPGGAGMFIIVDRDDVPTPVNAVEMEVTGDSARNFWETRVKMRVAGPEGDVWMGEDEFPILHPEMRRIYVEVPYEPTAGETTRMYQFMFVNAANLEEELSGWLSFPFNRNEIKRTNAKVEWQGDQPTPPEPPTPPPVPPSPTPPTDGIQGLLRQIAADLEDHATDLRGVADSMSEAVTTVEYLHHLFFPEG